MNCGNASAHWERAPRSETSAAEYAETVGAGHAKLDDGGGLLANEETGREVEADPDAAARMDDGLEAEATRELATARELRVGDDMGVDMAEGEELRLVEEVLVEEGELPPLTLGLPTDMTGDPEDSKVLRETGAEPDEPDDDTEETFPTSSAPLMPGLSNGLPTEPFK